MYAIILGIVQGIAEFLPISSSAHLIITSWWMEGAPLSMTLNVSLHIGTLSAVLIYFRQDWFELFQGALHDLRTPQSSKSFLHKWAMLIFASVPAGLLGISAKNTIETYFHNPLSTTLPLSIVGLLLWWGDRRYPKDKTLDQMSYKDAIFIGCAQATALIPGVSRSGATMLAARCFHYTRTDAARFSFLLGTPAMGGAAILHYKDILSSLHDPVFQVGVLTSCLVGCATIHLLMKWIQDIGFGIFAIYRCLLAGFILYLYHGY